MHSEFRFTCRLIYKERTLLNRQKERKILQSGNWSSSSVKSIDLARYGSWNSYEPTNGNCGNLNKAFYKNQSL